jgi:hypothetical protein
LQYSHVTELSRITGLNFQFATHCMVESGWEPTRALEVFQQAKVSDIFSLGQSQLNVALLE